MVDLVNPARYEKDFIRMKFHEVDVILLNLLSVFQFIHISHTH